jgi:N-acetylglutamate synthase-like GNAT family acetyltransferase
MKIALLKEYPEFIPELAELFHEQWNYLHPELKLPDLEKGLKNQANGKIIPTIIIALNENTLLGSASLIKNDMKTRMELSPWLGGVYVKQEFRNRGIGRKLIEEIENISKELNVSHLYLITEHKVEYYENQNWNLFEKTKYKNLDVVIMRKEIQPK